MNARVVICCLAFGAMAARAYWMDTPLEQLAAQSDCVVIGRVTSIVADTNTFRLRVTMNELMSLKGSQGLGDSVSFDAPFTLMHCVQFQMKLADAQSFVRDIPNTFIGPSTWNTNEVQIISLDSFATNETCAVFLKQNLDNRGSLQLVSESDGKFYFDRAMMRLHKAVRSTATNYISFETFAPIVWASPAPVIPGIVAAPTFAPTLTLTNLPIDLILPRAITR
jgi:hypothetical protein